MDLKKEFKTNHSLLLVISGSKYAEVTLKVMKSLSGVQVCYVSLNKTYMAIREKLEKHNLGVGNIIFVDAISKTMQLRVVEEKNCHFVSSPSALTELSMVIDSVLNNNVDFLVFDSLSNLLIYEKKANVQRFALRLVNRIREKKLKCIFCVTGEECKFIDEISPFFDKVVKIK